MDNNRIGLNNLTQIQKVVEKQLRMLEIKGEAKTMEAETMEMKEENIT